MRIEGRIFHGLEFNQQNCEPTCQRTHQAQNLKKSEETTARGQNSPTGSSSRRKLPIEDGPATLMDVEGGLMEELQTWLNTSLVRTVQQLGETSRGLIHGDDNVQILLNVLDGCKLKLTTVARQGEVKMQLFADVGDRERWVTQWYYFVRKRGGIYYQVDEQIRVLGSYVHQDIAAKLNNGCGLIREELGVQLCWIKDVQRDISQGCKILQMM